eukprot:TRINITY_DN103656_c0_g1_i1.p1 TRINITY_DN103656_c0_g1~~TRINITY_DN103656_c0_g1_i1.p1  ORF type:complete len:122 (+),score=6.36 TRINITY_DN103656_c0_g1_i1:55-420(+)
MGKKKVTNEYRSERRDRSLCFYQRRVGLLRKAMELATMTGTKVQLRFLNEEHDTLVEFQSHDQSTMDAACALFLERGGKPHLLNASNYTDNLNRLLGSMQLTELPPPPPLPTRQHVPTSIQ